MSIHSAAMQARIGLGLLGLAGAAGSWYAFRRPRRPLLQLRPMSGGADFVGTCSGQGRRDHMEDEFIVAPNALKDRSPGGGHGKLGWR